MRRGMITGLALLAMAVLPGQSCGPFFTEAVFVSLQPESRAALMNGKIGIVWPEFGTMEMALVYRRLQGPAFTGEEEKQVLAAAPSTGQQLNLPGIAQWMAARKEVTGRDGEAIATDATVPGQQWQTYPNCLDDAFTNAAEALRKRATDHAAEKDNVAAWIEGQDAVFSNCAKPGELPPKSPSAMPEWLREDRAYQTAAAHFYRAEWEPAETGFRAIADDPRSVWRKVAEYLVARTLVRKAMLSKPQDGAFDLTPMQAARQQLQTVIRKGGQYAAAAQALLRFVDLRTAPEATAARLGEAIAKPDPHLSQDLIDLRYALSTPASFQANAEARGSDLVDWVLTTKAQIDPEKAAAHSLERWRATQSTAWLVSAIMLAQSPASDLMTAAAALPNTSPAWVAASYYRLRLARDESEIVLLLPELKNTESASTVNAFQELAQKQAISLEEFVSFAAMAPAGYIDGTGAKMTPGAVAAAAPGVQAPTMAGLPVNATGTMHLSLEAAKVLNQRLPLETLASIVQRQALPRQILFELAMAVWTRAVLLNRPEIARTLTPAMIEGEPGWKPWVSAYEGAKTESDRRLAALLALMRFPSVRPYVNAGATREDGFVGYSAYRDNWWCAGMGNDTRGASSYSAAYNFQAGGPAEDSIVSVAAQPRPPFVTVGMAKEAKQEEAELLRVGDAPAYFGSQALAWAKAHPRDARGAELLGFAFRAMRNGCNLEQSENLRRQVFDMLHTGYAESAWARRYAKFTSDSP